MSRRRRLRTALGATCVLALALAAGTALAAAGALDPSFSNDGKTLVDFQNGKHTDRANDVALAPGGKIVLAGRANFNGSDEFGIARLRSDGARDSSFSGDGKKVVSFGSGFDEARGVAVQKDGKIVAAGHTNTSGAGFAITRVTAGGDLDHTFSGDGKRLQPFGPSNFADANAVAIQPNGMIVVVGVTNATGTVTFAIAQFKPNGQPDTSFSGDGRRTVAFAGGSSDARAVAIGSDGSIVVAGDSNGDHAFAVARLKPNGNMDTSFSGDGKATVPFSNAVAFGVAVQSDGRVVATGYADNGTGNLDMTVVRLTKGGQPDSSFSGDGIRFQSFDNGSNFDEGTDVALQRDGKIVVVGFSFHAASGSDFAIARFRSNGSLDTSFSGDGKRLQSFNDNGSNSDIANGVAIDSSGRIVVAGVSDPPGTPRDDFAVARYLGS